MQGYNFTLKLNELYTSLQLTPCRSEKYRYYIEIIDIQKIYVLRSDYCRNHKNARNLLRFKLKTTFKQLSNIFCFLLVTHGIHDNCAERNITFVKD